MHGYGVPHRPSGAEVLWQKDALHVPVTMDRREKKRETITDLPTLQGPRSPILVSNVEKSVKLNMSL